MESFSESSDSSFVDDELVIGPLNESEGVEYIKKLLLRKPDVTEGYRRRSYSGTKTPLENLTDASEVSEYFTPDTTTSASNANANFLEKMQAMLDEDENVSVQTSFKTACDHTIHNNSTLNHRPTRRSSLPRISTATLINDMKTLSFANVDNNTHDIEISDNELDDDFLRYQGTQIKYENITVDDIEDYSSMKECDKENNSEIYDVDQSSTDLSYYDGDSSLLCVDNQNYENYQIPNGSIRSETDCKYATNEFGNVSTSSTESFRVPVMTQSAIPLKKTALKTPKMISSGNHVQREEVKSKNIFLTPTSFKKPLEKNKSDKANKFKHIQSPVSFYIKNSATAPICRNMQVTKLPPVLPDSLFEGTQFTDDSWTLFEIPDVIYKPSAVQYQSQGREVLPRNIQVLVPTLQDMYMTKHERRIKNVDETKESIRRRLNEDMNLTYANQNSSMAGTHDISIVQVKQYFK